MESEPQRVCLLTGPTLQNWAVEAVERMIAETGVEVTMVVVDSSQQTENDGSRPIENTVSVGLRQLKLFVKKLREERFWAFVHAERHLSWKLGGPSTRWKEMQPVPVDSIDAFSDSTFVDCNPIDTGGVWVEFPDWVVDTVSESADIVIRFDFGLIRGDILTRPEYGVLSFHPADIRQYRGLSTSLAYINGDNELGITLQRLSPSIDGGEIVAFKRVDISDACSLDEVYGRLKQGQKSMLSAGIRNLRNPDFTPEVPEQLPEYIPVKEKYRFSYAGRVVLKNIVRRIRKRGNVL